MLPKDGHVKRQQRATGSSNIIIAKRHILVAIVLLGIPLCLIGYRLIELTMMDDIEDRNIGFASFQVPLVSRTKMAAAAAVASNDTTITATSAGVSKKNKVFQPKATIRQVTTPAKKNVEDGGVSDSQADSSATGKNKPTVKDFSLDRDILKPPDATIVLSSPNRNQEVSSHNNTGDLFEKTITTVSHNKEPNRSIEVPQHKDLAVVLKPRTETGLLVHYPFHNSSDGTTPNATNRTHHKYVRYHPSYEIIRQQVDDGNLTAGQFILDFAIIGFPKCGTSTMSKYDVCSLRSLS
jgi:hypothetical protein